MSKPKESKKSSSSSTQVATLNLELFGKSQEQAVEKTVLQIFEEMTRGQEKKAAFAQYSENFIKVLTRATQYFGEEIGAAKDFESKLRTLFKAIGNEYYQVVFLNKTNPDIIFYLLDKMKELSGLVEFKADNKDVDFREIQNLFALAFFRKIKGEDQKAVECYEQIWERYDNMSMQPSDAVKVLVSDGLYFQARIYFRNSDLGKSKKEVRRLLKKSDQMGNIAAKNSLGIIFLEQRRYEAAFNSFAVASYRGNCEAQYYVGICYENGIGVEQDLEKARRYFRSAEYWDVAFAKESCQRVASKMIASETASAKSHNYWGLCYQYGWGVPIDMKKAFDHFATAAGLRSYRAKSNLALFYKNGWVVKQDINQAINLMIEAAEGGDVAAHYNLMAFYQQGGMGINPDLEAVEYFGSRAKELGGVFFPDHKNIEQDSEAKADENVTQNNFGFGNLESYEQSYVENMENPEEELTLLESEAARGEVWAQLTLGVRYMNGSFGGEPNYKMAFELFQSASRAGNIEARYYLGLCYKRGAGVVQDYMMAYRLFCSAVKGGGLFEAFKAAQDVLTEFTEAAKEGDAEATKNIGLCYKDGLGLPQDNEKAFKFFLRAKELGNTEAYNYLGLCYKDGIGCEKNPQMAFGQFQIAANFGSISGRINLALCYKKGDGVETNLNEAFRNFYMAATAGNAVAQNYVGLCYQNGIGINQDLKGAAHWFELSAKAGNSFAKRNLAIVKTLIESEKKTTPKSVVETFSEATSVEIEEIKDQVVAIELVKEQEKVVVQFPTMEEIQKIDFKIEPEKPIDEEEKKIKIEDVKEAQPAKEEEDQEEYIAEEFQDTKEQKKKSNKIVEEIAKRNRAKRKEFKEKAIEKKRQLSKTDSVQLEVDPNLVLKTQLQEKMRSGDKEAEKEYRKLEANSAFKLGLSFFHGQKEEKVSEVKAKIDWRERVGKTGKNLAMAQRLFHKADNYGHLEAAYHEALCYFEGGEGFIQDKYRAVEILTISAQKKNPHSQYHLGCCYAKGNGVREDIEEAVKFVKASAQQGFQKAKDDLPELERRLKKLTKEEKEKLIQARMKEKKERESRVQLYLTPKDEKQITELKDKLAKSGDIDKLAVVESDLKHRGQIEPEVRNITNKEEAFHFSKRAADQGDAKYQYIVGQSYKDGNGVQKDLNEAFRYFRLSAKQGYAKAICNLGNCYRDGEGVNQDLKKAFSKFQLAANKGSGAAQCNLGVLYIKGGGGVTRDYSKALHWLNLAVKTDFKGAYFNLGQMHENGWGMPKNLQEAIRCYHIAADEGIKEAQYKLVKHYRDNKTKEGQENFARFSKIVADRERDCESQFNVGMCYEKGVGVDKNPGEAFRYTQLSAKQEDNKAQYVLGTYYYRGFGVDKNPGEAVRLFQLSADKGNVEAQIAVGKCYKNGIGVEIDYQAALDYYKLAAKQGDEEAKSEMAELLKLIASDTEQEPSPSPAPLEEGIQALIETGKVKPMSRLEVFRIR